MSFFERVKEKFKTKNKQNLENLYELVYEVEVNKNNRIAHLEKLTSEYEYQIMELNEKISKYKEKYKELKGYIHEKDDKKD